MTRKATITVLIFILLLAMFAFASCGSGGTEDSDPGDTADPAVQQDEQNPDGAEVQSEGKGQENEQNGQNQQSETEDVKEDTEVNTDNIKINTQSSIRIEGSKTVYSDPYKITKAAHDADIIFITHAHYDHYDEPSLRNVAKENSTVVCPASMLADVKRMNVGGKVIGMKAGETEEVAEGITAEAVPAYNSNKNFHPKANGWVGYIITMDGVKYYAAGDTDALPELEDVECDIAFVPVGGTYTMTASEAAGLVNKISPAVAIPIHYGTIVGRAADADTFASGLDDGIKVVKKVEDAR